MHGGSGFIMEYKSQRLYRDARIFSIYEGTTQLQVVAAIRYITNGTYLGIIKEMLENEVAEELKPLQERVKKMVELYEQAVNYAKELGDQEAHDFLARRLYDMTGDILMSLLILDDATRAPQRLRALRRGRGGRPLHIRQELHRRRPCKLPRGGGKCRVRKIPRP